MICVEKPSAKLSYWDKQEPPVYSASLAVFNASDKDSYLKALSQYKSETKKDHKITYFVINQDTSDDDDDVDVEEIVTTLKADLKSNRFQNYFLVNLKTGDNVNEMILSLSRALLSKESLYHNSRSCAFYMRATLATCFLTLLIIVEISILQAKLIFYTTLFGTML